MAEVMMGNAFHANFRGGMRHAVLAFEHSHDR
jgi:hypothetical protein